MWSVLCAAPVHEAGCTMSPALIPVDVTKADKAAKNGAPAIMVMVCLVRDSWHCCQLCICYSVANAAICCLQLDSKLLVEQSCVLKELAKRNLDLQC